MPVFRTRHFVPTNLVFEKSPSLNAQYDRIRMSTRHHQCSRLLDKNIYYDYLFQFQVTRSVSPWLSTISAASALKPVAASMARCITAESGRRLAWFRSIGPMAVATSRITRTILLLLRWSHVLLAPFLGRRTGVCIRQRLKRPVASGAGAGSRDRVRESWATTLLGLASAGQL